MNLATTASRTAARIVAAIVAVAALFLPTFPPMVREWIAYPSLSHGFAIPIVALYLGWRQRPLAGDAGSWTGLLLLVPGLAMYAVGTVGGEPFIARSALPVTLLGALLLVVGAQASAALAPAIAYLHFMIPLPYALVRDLTDRATVVDAALTAEALRWVGVPVLRHGTLLHLPDLSLHVADVCSSVPWTTTLLALGVAYGAVRQRPVTVRIALLLLAVPLGFASNVLRIVFTSLGAHYIGQVALDNVVHAWSGMTMFLLTFASLLALDRGIERLAAVR